jgi:hypothetical protein
MKKGGGVLRALVHLLYDFRREGADVDVVCTEAGEPMRLPRSFCDVTRSQIARETVTRVRRVGSVGSVQ